MCWLRKPRGKHEAFPDIYVREQSRIEQVLISILGGALGESVMVKLQEWLADFGLYAWTLARTTVEPLARLFAGLLFQGARIVWELLLRLMGS